MKSVKIRFYEELNDFLPEESKKIRFTHSYIDTTSVKDLIESFGVPHTEIDLILVNGISIGFDYLINNGDYISVYPVFESFDITNVQHLRPKALRRPKFVLDVHLGKLAKFMRMIGIDTLYRNDYEDEEIVKISLKEKRTILTKDLGILKRKQVTHGYYVRNIDPSLQIQEIVGRFQLESEIKELSRCIECNEKIVSVHKEDILDKLPLKVRKWQSEFFQCPGCKNIYWKGSHYDNMIKMIRELKGKEGI